MEITYLQCPDGHKLFSFFRHDYNQHTSKDNVLSFIDGGRDYFRYGGEGELKTSNIEEVIKDVREQFKWGRNYDENKNKLDKTEYILLKNLNTGHIINILKYFTDLLPKSDYKVNDGWVFTHSIFLEELIYRSKQNIL